MIMDKYVDRLLALAPVGLFLLLKYGAGLDTDVSLLVPIFLKVTRII
jgi:hypothetical protein